ncbi:phospholipid-binding protein [bacterium]|nr:MAG: phospholipid-binding protein [bacterium]
MKLHIPSFGDGDAIPHAHAFGIIDEKQHVALGQNLNPHVVWSDLPPGTESLALVCHDPDVPSVGDDVNQEGRSVRANLPRVDFTHWVLVDIDPDLGEIKAGADSDSVTPRGKPGGQTAHGRRGRNDYTGWFAGDTVMGGSYNGYDGPGPPWNDERLHHYIFTLFALDCAALPVKGDFGRDETLAAMQGHILAEDAWTGTYTLNPALA